MRGLAVLTVVLALAAAGGALARERRAALVVAISNYEPPLPASPNAERDADLVSAALRGVAFDVDLRKDASRADILAAVAAFSDRLAAIRRDGDEAIALFYFAGHGVQDVRETNFIVGADSRLTTQFNLPATAIALDDVFRAIEAGAPAAVVAIVDACRDTPLPLRSVARGTGVAGLAPPDDRRDVLIAFPAEPGRIAIEGAAGGVSPFAAALARRLPIAGLEARQTFDLVAQDVFRETGGRQFPRVFSTLTRPLAFRAAPDPGAGVVDGDPDYGRAVLERSEAAYDRWLRAHPDDARRAAVATLRRTLFDDDVWRRAQTGGREEQISALSRLIVSFPDSVHAGKAKARLAALTQDETPRPASSAPADAALWDHDGSTLTLAASGSLRRFSYAQPKPGLPAPRGAVLFDGLIVGGRYAGTAWLFSPHCPSVGYAVEGPASQDRGVIALRGREPVRGDDCAVRGYRDATLTFTALRRAE